MTTLRLWAAKHGRSHDRVRHWRADPDFPSKPAIFRRTAVMVAASESSTLTRWPWTHGWPAERISHLQNGSTRP
jgi:hypothetical protein